LLFEIVTLNLPVETVVALIGCGTPDKTIVQNWKVAAVIVLDTSVKGTNILLE